MVLVVYALVVLLDQMRFRLNELGAGESIDVVTTVDIILPYTVVGLVAWRSTWASVASVTCLVASAVHDFYGSVIVTICVVTAAVVATATQRFIAAHLLVYLVWTLVAANLDDPFDDSLFWSTINALILASLVGSAARYFQHHRRRNEARVRDLEILNQRLRDDERQALARDLHDVVAHELTLITMQTMSRRRSDDVEELHQVLETVEDAARSGLHELRVLLRLLRNDGEGEAPRDVTGAGLSIGSLDHVITSLTASLRDLEFQPEVVITGNLETMPTTLRGTAARILQEAATNIIKYAPRGTACRIEVKADERELCLNVTNPLPGRGGDPGGSPSELSSGLGLRGITERVSLLGGRSWSGPEEDQWILSVCLPVERREAL